MTKICVQARVKHPLGFLFFSLSITSFCNPVKSSTSAFPVLHCLPEFAETYVHWVSHAIQPSHLLLPPSLPSFNLSQQRDRSKWFGSSHQNHWAFTSASVLPMNIHGWFPLGLTGLTSFQSKGPSKSSPAPQFKSINSLTLSLLYGPALTCLHDCWKNHSFD